MKAKIGFIGCGSRASAYAHNLQRLEQIDAEYVALCDTNPRWLGMFNERFAKGAAQTYPDFRDLLVSHEDLDGVVICTPNDTHEAIALQCLGRGAHVILEKPLATTPAACLNILRAAEQHSGSVTLGFVLRYTPFYRKVRELFRSGVCGQVSTIIADEFVHPEVSRLMCGTWRKTEARSGGALLEKCCHDLDIFNWLMGRLPVRVSSTGDRTVFVRNPDAGERCSACDITEECGFFVDMESVDDQAARAHEWRNLITWDDTCLFNGETDNCDHQVVTMEYDDGTVLTFTMAFGVDISRRSICIVGSRGRIEGDLGTGTLELGRTKGRSREAVSIEDDGSGHHGGDGEIARAFEQALLGRDYTPSATVEAGFHSAMLAFTAERARREQRAVEVAETYAALGLKSGSTEAL